MNDELIDWKSRYKDLKYKYNKIIQQLAKQDNIYKRLEDKYKNAILEYSKVIQTQIDLGVELEGRVKDLEAQIERLNSNRHEGKRP